MIEVQPRERVFGMNQVFSAFFADLFIQSLSHQRKTAISSQTGQKSGYPESSGFMGIGRTGLAHRKWNHRSSFSVGKAWLQAPPGGGAL
jgi:hypothetical protein